MEYLEVAEILFYAAAFVGVAGAGGLATLGLGLLGTRLIKQKSQAKYTEAVAIVGAVTISWLILSGIFSVVALAMLLAGSVA